nr:hyp [Cotesia vestalis bracovirus]
MLLRKYLRKCLNTAPAKSETQNSNFKRFFTEIEFWHTLVYSDLINSVKT